MSRPDFEFSPGVLSQHSSPFSQIPDRGSSVGLGDQMIVAEPHGDNWRMVLRRRHGDDIALAEKVDAFEASRSIVGIAAAIQRAKS